MTQLSPWDAVEGRIAHDTCLPASPGSGKGPPEQTFLFMFRSRGDAPATIGIGAKIVGHARYAAFQVPDVAISKNLFAEFL